MNKIKKYPPYSKRLFEYMKDKQNPIREILIFLGKDAWKKGQSFLNKCPVVILPPDSNRPQDYDWGCVKGLSVLVFDTSDVGSELIRRLSYELLMAGATIVRVVFVNFGMAIFRRGGFKI